MLQPGREFNVSGYRYGFSRKENDNEVKGAENQIDFGERAYDPRIGRWISTDKVVKAPFSFYQYSRNNPVNYIDPNGNDEIHFYYTTQQWLDKDGNSFTTITWSAKVIENGSKAHTFFIHNASLGNFDNDGKGVEVFPFETGTNLPRTTSFAAAENCLPFATQVRSFLWGGGQNYTNDYEFLGKLLQVSPELKEHYKNDRQTTWSFVMAEKFGGTAEFATKLLGASETIFAVIDGYYAVRALASLAVQGPRIVSSLIESSRGLSAASRKGLSSFKGVEGVYVHQFTSGRVYVGQALDLADRPVTSLKELLDVTGKHKGTVAKAGDTYSGTTRFIPLKGSGYKSLN